MNTDEPIRNMICSVCGARCKCRQHWNRDTGFGLCQSCDERLIKKHYSQKEMENLYGRRGYHYAIPESTQDSDA